MSIHKAERPAPLKRKHDNIGDIRSFMESGWDCAEVDLNGRKAGTAYTNLRECAKAHGFAGVYVMKRGEHVYLIRDYSADLIGEGA